MSKTENYKVPTLNDFKVKVQLVFFLVGLIIFLYVIISAVVEVATENSDTSYWGVAQEIVKEQLKSPSSAKFPAYHDTFVTSNNGDIIVQSYVEADNSFGVKLKKSFKVVFKDGDFDNYTVSVY